MTKPLVTVTVGTGFSTDISSQVRLAGTPVSITRGRGDEFSDVQASTLSFAVDISTSPLPSAVVVGAAVRVQVTVGGLTTNRFTGFIDSLQTGFPGGSTSEILVGATDAWASLNRRQLDSTLTQTIRALSPAAYYPMDEPEGSLSVGDRSGNGWPSLSLAQRGVGGTFAAGSGAGPVTEQGGAVSFERASASAGPYLTADYVSPLPFSSFSFVVCSSTVAAQSWVRLRYPDTEKLDGSPVLEIGCNGSGFLRVSSAWMGGFTGVGAVNVCDGVAHVVTVRCAVSWVAGSFVWQVLAYLDNGNVVSGQTSALGRVFAPSAYRVEVGGASSGGSMASASISRLAFWQSLALADLQTVAVAASTGFTADRTDQRIARIAAWAGVTSTALEVGSVTATAHQDITGMSPAAAMQTVAQTERGMVFIDGSGQLVCHARAHRYAPSWTALVNADALASDLTFATDTQSLINRAVIARPGGASQEVRDEGSITAYGEYQHDAELLYVTDADALGAASWLVNTNSTPRPRISTVTVDLLTQTQTITQQMQALELGSLIGITGLPPQAPAGGLSLFAEGWTESISIEAWDMALNTSALDSPWVIESPSYGQLDSWRLV